MNVSDLRQFASGAGHGAAPNRWKTIPSPIMFRANRNRGGRAGGRARASGEASQPAVLCDEERSDREIRARTGVDAPRLEFAVPCVQLPERLGKGTRRQRAMQLLTPLACLARDTLRHRQPMFAHNV